MPDLLEDPAAPDMEWPTPADVEEWLQMGFADSDVCAEEGRKRGIR